MILIYKSFFKDFKEIKLVFLSHMIKDGKYLSQKIYEGSTCKRVSSHK